MNTEHRQGHLGKTRVQFSHSEARAAPPVPDRHSSAICSYQMALSRANTNILNGPAEDDAYLRALAQLSATHCPSLDNLPLDRLPTADSAAPPIPPDEITRQYPSSANPRTVQAADTGSQVSPIVAGQRYHTLPDGSAYIEAVYGSAHYQETLDPNTPNKVRPAAAVPPFHDATTSDNTAIHAKASSTSSSSRFAALNHMPTFRYAEEFATTAGSCGSGPGDEAQEGREDRRGRWLRWHASRAGSATA
ncbi:hypothetical protein N657DRAFT_647025 [Parathielavia appendiculata]|uniref:Uncharacterized protein n=1 Tax=Parathielavia appendiculata TaxID=2587402 RepID=A0AAN6TXG1_9PEZI|nr:hypothetical protein N657DRAFT_647025 [Parathielavia appendiculata]